MVDLVCITFDFKWGTFSPPYSQKIFFIIDRISSCTKWTFIVNYTLLWSFMVSSLHPWPPLHTIETLFVYYLLSKGSKHANYSWFLPVLAVLLEFISCLQNHRIIETYQHVLYTDTQTSNDTFCTKLILSLAVKSRFLRTTPINSSIRTWWWPTTLNIKVQKGFKLQTCARHIWTQ